MTIELPLSDFAIMVLLFLSFVFIYFIVRVYEYALC
jgi:hypothetical protein